MKKKQKTRKKKEKGDSLDFGSWLVLWLCKKKNRKKNKTKKKKTNKKKEKQKRKVIV